MQPIPLVRGPALLPLVQYLDRFGVEPGPELARVRPLLRDPAALLPMSLAGVAFEESAQRAGERAIGLRTGEATRVLEFHAWGGVIRRSRTVGALLDAIGAEIRRFNAGVRFWAIGRDAGLALHWRATSRVVAGRGALNEFVLELLSNAVRVAAGPAWSPDEIHLEGPAPPHAEEIAALARRRTVFDRPCCAIVFPEACLALRFPDFVPADQDDAGVAPADEFGASVRQLVETLCRLGTPALSIAAEAARMSERSLQRQLAASGLTFAGLVDDARFAAACRLLGDPARKIIEIASELGYTDSGNFTRAFRRWAGVPPQAYRAAL